MSTENIEQLAQEFKAATDKVKEYGEELKGKMANGEQLSQAAKDKADEAIVAMNELKARLDELEQKSARRGDSPEKAKSLGAQVVESEAFKAMQADPRGVGKIKVKANITSATADADGSAGALIPQHRVEGVITPPNRRMTIRDLIMPGQTASNAITYMRETGFTNNAAAQNGEGNKKAQSNLKYDEQTVNVATLAHFIKVSRQVFDDAPQLSSQINGRLMYGLQLVEEQQILNGDGQNGNLKGIIPQATAFADKATLAKYSIIDQLRLAILQVALAEYPAEAHVLNPIDWTKIELLKDDNGRYIIGDPQEGTAPTLWRLPVVETQSMGVGKFLTGAFGMAAQLFDRQESAVYLGFENDDFTRNMLTVLAEQRLALAVYRPEAFIYGTLAEKA